MIYQEKYNESIANKEHFWRHEASKIEWFSLPEAILGSDEDDLYRWYQGGKLNTSYLALDKHVNDGRGAQTALI